MTMDLSGDAFFLSYLMSLSDKQLDALTEWQGERLSDSPDDDNAIADALSKKKMIWEERRRREKG